MGVGYVNLDKTEVCGIDIDAGENGIDALFMENIQPAENPETFHSPSLILNDYKCFVRENIPNNVFETRLRQLLTHFDENKQIRSQYDALSLVNELQGIERHYLKLCDRISFVPFVESLLRRIDAYADNTFISNDDKKVLYFLYAATRTKLSCIENRANHASTIDLLAYTEFIQNHIKRLRSAERDGAIYENEKNFKHSLENKIGIANHFIKCQILPDIRRNFTKIDRQIVELIKENTSTKTAVIERELKNTLIREKIRFWIEVIGPLIMCLGITAAIVFTFAKSFKNLYHGNRYKMKQKFDEQVKTLMNHICNEQNEQTNLTEKLARCKDTRLQEMEELKGKTPLGNLNYFDFSSLI